MDAPLIKQFAEYGGYIGILTGVVVLFLITALGVLWKYLLKVQAGLTDLQNRRVEEAKEVRELLLEVSAENNKVIFGLTEAMRALKDAILTRGR